MSISELVFESEQLASMAFSLYMAHEYAPDDWQSYTPSLFLLSNLLVAHSKALNDLYLRELNKSELNKKANKIILKGSEK